MRAGAERRRALLACQRALAAGADKAAALGGVLPEVGEAAAGGAPAGLGLRADSPDGAARKMQAKAISLIGRMASSILYRRNAREGHDPDWEVLALIARDYFPQMRRAAELLEYGTVPDTPEFRAMVRGMIENQIRKGEENENRQRD